MKIFYSTSFKGHYPVGTTALIVAEDIEKAANQLSCELKEHGLSQPININQITEINTTTPRCFILQDGDYWLF